MKNTLTYIALILILVCGIAGVRYAYYYGTVTYDGSKTNVVELYENPEVYDNSDPDGVAAIIVNENLDKTKAANNVASIVFNFRGFDTLGEAFILLTSITGSMVILSAAMRSSRQRREDGSHEI